MSVFEKLDTTLATDINYDVGYRELLVLDKKIRLYYLNSLVDGLQSIEIIEGVLKLNEALKHESIKYFDLIKNNLNHLDVSEVAEIEVMCDTVLSGLVLLAIEDEVRTLKIDTRSYPNRSVGEPDMEKVVRGPHDGFTENLNTNIGLMNNAIANITIPWVNPRYLITDIGLHIRNANTTHKMLLSRYKSLVRLSFIFIFLHLASFLS